jgi:hypothetical protein
MSVRALVSTVVVCCLAGAPAAQEAAITGAIVEDHSGAPLPGATIGLVDSDGRTIATAQTDRTGRFGVHGMAAGTYTLQAEKLHYVPLRARFSWPGAAGHEPIPALRLIRHGSIAGRGSAVTVIERVPDGIAPRTFSGNTDRSGAFRVFGLPPALYAVQGRTARDGAPHVGLVPPLNAPSELAISGGIDYEGLTFAAPDTAIAVEGRVDTSAIAEPLRIVLSLVDTSEPTLRLWSRSLATDRMFRIENVLPGSYELRAVGTVGLRAVAFGRMPFTAGVHDLGDLMMTMTRGLSLELRLEDEQPRPSQACGGEARATLTLLDYWTFDVEKPAIVTRGTPVRIDGLAPARYRVMARAVRGECPSPEVTLDLSAAHEPPVRHALVLRPPARLQGRVRAAPARVRVAVVLSDITPGRTSPVQVLFTTAGEPFEFDDLADGRYHLKVHDASSPRWSPDMPAEEPFTFRIAAGDIKTVDIQSSEAPAP